jgi:predicted GTPase
VKNNIDKHFDIAQEIIDKTEKDLKELNPVNILLIGKSGVGKSTLINSVFREKIADTGIGKPVTKHLQQIKRDDVPITLYDTRGLELNPDVQKQVRDEIYNLISDKKGTKDAIHVAYYCIQGTSSRIEDLEIRMIKEISEKIPVILVLTQAIGEQAQNFEQYIKEMNLPVVAVHSVLAQPYVISEDYTVEAFGLKELIERTFHLIPERVRKAFTNAQRVDIERKASSAKNWAARYIATSFGIGFIPIPFSDASLLVPMQVTLLAHITVIFGVPIDKGTLLSIIAAVGGTGSATFIGRSIVSNAFKFIPGVGTIAGGIISGTTASIVTRALAHS